MAEVRDPERVPDLVTGLVRLRTLARLVQRQLGPVRQPNDRPVRGRIDPAIHIHRGRVRRPLTGDQRRIDLVLGDRVRTPERSHLADLQQPVAVDVTVHPHGSIESGIGVTTRIGHREVRQRDRAPPRCRVYAYSTLLVTPGAYVPRPVVDNIVGNGSTAGQTEPNRGFLAMRAGDGVSPTSPEDVVSINTGQPGHTRRGPHASHS